MHYGRSGAFLAAGKTLLAGDTVWAATFDEVRTLRRKALSFNENMGDLTFGNRQLKKV